MFVWKHNCRSNRIFENKPATLESLNGIIVFNRFESNYFRSIFEYLLLSTVCHIVSVVGDIGTRGGVAYLVAPLCRIMSSLLKDDLPWPQRQTVRRPRAAPEGTSAQSGTRPEESRSPRSRAWLFLTFFFFSFFFNSPSPDTYCEVDISSRTVALTGEQTLWVQLGMHFEYCLVSSQNFPALFENPSLPCRSYCLLMSPSAHWCFLSAPFVSLKGSWSPSAHWLLPCNEAARARLAPVSVACVPSTSVAYPQVSPQRSVSPSPPLSW